MKRNDVDEGMRELISCCFSRVVLAGESIGIAKQPIDSDHLLTHSVRRPSQSHKFSSLLHIVSYYFQEMIT